jgi:class 3 adenylate cyclase
MALLRPAAAAVQDAFMEIPETRYAITPDGIYLAYQAVGEGPVDLVWQLDLFGNIDLVWETDLGNWFSDLASFSRLILHDRRGTGLSSRNVAPPDLETRVADLGVILDAVGSERPVLGGEFDGGAPNVMFAGSQPERVHSLVWWEPQPRNTWAPDYPWGVDDDYLERSAKVTAEYWGTDGFGAAFAEVEASVGNDVPGQVTADLSKLARHTVTPDVAIALDRMWQETDVRSILPSVTAPTLLLPSGNKEIAEYVASLMPDAKVRMLPGTPELDDPAIIAEIREWVGIAPTVPDLDRVLATVLFTDIVGSTERLTEMGDAGWRSVLKRHNERARAEIDRHGGRFVDSTGDGVFATFDGPARAVRCAKAIGAAVGDLGIQIRAGAHTGEVVLEGEAVRGIAVHVGARVAALAGPSEVLVSQTVKDLVAGSGLTFEDAGEHELKGVTDRWRLYRVAD